MSVIPAGFLALADRSPAWGEWMARLPRLVSDLVEEWDLRVDGPVSHGRTAVVVPVLTSEGVPAALKVGWPHPEARFEHLALRAWDGDGAVRLLRADPHRSALLLERASAVDLTAVDVVEACEIVGGLYGRLHRPALPQLDRLSAHTARWVEELTALLADPRVPRRFVEQAVSLARDFAADAGTDVALVHTDLQYDNVLAAERDPWLVIDPEPLAGDPAYEVLPLLVNRWDEAVATQDVRGAMLDRLYAVVDAAGLDEDRVRSWVVLRSMVEIKAMVTSEGPFQPDSLTAGLTVVKSVQW